MSAGKRIRVLIVDDSALTRKLLTRMLAVADDMEVVGTAMDGSFALAKVEALQPDVVTLDLDMPHVDGLTALRQIVKGHRLPVVLVSSHTAAGASITFEALEAGAVDFVTKPKGILSNSLESLGAELLGKIRVAAGVKVRPPRRSSIRQAPQARHPASSRTANAARCAVLIAASTGGPNALSYLLPRVRADLGAAILIVQHMPEGFTSLFAKHLAELSDIPVHEAAEGQLVVAGEALVAPGGRHLKVRMAGSTPVVVLSASAPVNGMRPSADILFQSAVEVFGGRSVGLIMTGMGEDGAQGMQAIRAAGGRTIAQDRSSSVVFGMPGAAIDRQAVQKVLPLVEIGPYLNALDLGQGGVS